MRAAVLISGTGRTLKNLIDLKDQLKVNIDLVMVSNTNVIGKKFAVQNKITCCIPNKLDNVFDVLDENYIDVAILGGWLKLLKVPAHWTNRVMNIHPSLLPAFGGKGMYGHKVHEAVLESGAKFSGCTVHFVDNEYDHGPIIHQRIVPVLRNDTPDMLAARVFEQEISLYPQVINWFAEDKLEVNGRRVFVND